MLGSRQNREPRRYLTKEVLAWCDLASELALSVIAIPELISAFCRLRRQRKEAQKRKPRYSCFALSLSNTSHRRMPPCQLHCTCSTGRFHFYSDEGQEPPHIHVRTPDGECKFWLAPVRLARVDGVRPVEVRRIEMAVVAHEALFMEKWHEHTRD